MTMTNKVKFKEWTCEVTEHKYSNGRLALRLIDGDDHSPIATATMNIPEAELQPHEIIIKDYAENDGMHDALVEAGLIKPRHAVIEMGFVFADVCMWLGDGHADD